jgi:ABC-type transport system involved in multi-copper enzyme maturation permease subunit
MTSPQVVYAIRWLIRDTLRQSLASRLFWVLLFVSGVAIVFCLGVGIQGGESLRDPDDIVLRSPHGRMSLGFGAFHVALFRDGEAQVRFLQLLLAEWIAGAAGILLVLMWTAGFVPAFLEPSAGTVLMAKPVPRWLLLLGKYVGVLVFVAFQITVFVGGTWLALGIGTRYWLSAYLWCIPLLLLHFAAVYAFSVLLAVCTRSTIACVIGSVLFWLLCWGMNYAHNFALAMPAVAPGTPPLSPLTQALVDVGYWVLPKPVDLGMLVRDLLGAGDYFAAFPEEKAVRQSGQYLPDLSLFSSVLFAGVLLCVSARKLATTDY